MLKSMTGYGRTEEVVGDKTFLVEIKSLNGKQFDINLRLPAILKSAEFDIRSILSEQLQRGSIDCVISLKETGSAKPVTINTSLAKAYYEPIREIATTLGLDTSSILSALLKLPEVITPAAETLSAEEWNGFKQVLLSAIGNLNKHREEEGSALEKDILNRVANIEALQQEIAALEPARKQRMRETLEKQLLEQVPKDSVDQNRMEQELIYYIEKLDIHEEQIRLGNHCQYLREIIAEPGDIKGKKISFLLQEVGREINTTGSKASDSGIQKLVVQMKDELEKAKEQVLNVL
ncbi:MAG: YicC family protein [Dinghuibacter sp.]|nr:YicC family protein [Dinghuibacter sp.]